jgi:hypothetical protein
MNERAKASPYFFADGFMPYAAAGFVFVLQQFKFISPSRASEERQMDLCGFRAVENPREGRQA